MDAEIKSRWINALRSGDFPQTRFKLADDGGYCCLGVLCEIAEQDQVVIKTQTDDGSTCYTSKVDPNDRDISVPPLAVASWADLGGPNPVFRMPVDGFDNGTYDPMDLVNGKAMTSLADLNDNHKFNFEEIADIIEEYF